MSLDRKILDRIEKENLSIRPKWFFAVKNLVFGTGTFVATILGSISLALFFEVMALQGRNLTWLSVPYALAIAMAVFLILGYWMIKRIDYLYKLKFVAVLSVLFFLNLASGYLTYASGEARRIERELEEIPVYAKIIPVERELPICHTEKFGYRHREEKQKREEGKNEDKTGESYHRHHHSENYERDRDDRDEDRPNFRFKKACDADEDKIVEEKQNEDDDKGEPIKGEVKGVIKENSKEKIEEKSDDEDESREIDKKDASNDASQKDDEPEDNEADAEESD